MTSQQQQAHQFRQLHTAGVVVLPNAWDVASARLVEEAGASAIATTSAGVAWSLGAADGEALDRSQVADVARRIVAEVDVPVTVDLEAGYGASHDELAASVHAVLAAGAVGINLEDAQATGLRDCHAQAERIAVVRATADSAGVALFINARTDTYLQSVGDSGDRLAETVRRAERYLAAGADGVFVPGVLDPDTLHALVRQIPAPLNVMAGPGGPSVTELAELGVRRVSVGMGIAQAAYALVRRAARELLQHGTYDTLQDGLGYAELNAVFSE